MDYKEPLVVVKTEPVPAPEPDRPATLRLAKQAAYQVKVASPGVATVYVELSVHELRRFAEEQGELANTIDIGCVDLTTQAKLRDYEPSPSDRVDVVHSCTPCTIIVSDQRGGPSFMGEPKLPIAQDPAYDGNRVEHMQPPKHQGG